MELIKPLQLQELIKIRRHLHAHPELSGQEKDTALQVVDFLKKTQPDQIITGLGGQGVAAIYVFDAQGPSILVRADMDALPIEEINTFVHRSQVQGVSHKCGHDGHTTILLGLAHALYQKPLKTGRVVLLFQPEEETGKGALQVIQDEAFKIIQPDFALALHNLPGFHQNSVILKEGSFAAASRGMIIEIQGASSHAAHPEQGNSPATMLAHAIIELQALAQQASRFQDFVLATIIHARLGEEAFGTNPGKATLMLTLRAFLDADMQILMRRCEQLINKLAEDYKLKFSISYTESFPATVNDPHLCQLMRQAAEALDHQIVDLDQPFRWSEDFGHFSAICPSLLFGLGSGTDSPGLHNQDYDFPDDLLSPGIHLFHKMLELLVDDTA